jgi:hypothetical protein
VAAEVHHAVVTHADVVVIGVGRPARDAAREIAALTEQ